MWPRVRLDVGWSDLAFAALHCALPFDRERTRRRLELLWSAQGDALACHSVRSGFDLLLEALPLEAGDEILFSALNVKGMINIARRHGLVPVPVDLEVGTFGPRLDALERAISPRARALVVAHLFGARLDLAPVVEVARRRGLLLIEDCAQAFCGGEFRGHTDADVSMFSFGPLKTSTALGGALLRVRDAELLARMRAIQARHPLQTRRSLLVRVLKFAGLKIVTRPRVLGAIARGFWLARRDYEDAIADRVRGVAKLGSASKLRWRPCEAQLALIERRIRGFSQEALAARRAAGQRLRDLLAGAVPLPGQANAVHDYWVFPVLVDDPQRVIGALRRAGFDASNLPRSRAVAAPADRPKLAPEVARDALARLVVLPCHAAMPPSEHARQASLLRQLVAQPGSR